MVEDTQAPAEDPRIRRLAGWRRLAVLPFALLMRAWGRSLRFEIDSESLAIYGKHDEPVTFTLWHNRLFISPQIPIRYRRGRPVYALVSASRDGAWLSAFFHQVGIESVRGSSSKLGREAASTLIDTLREGKDIAITPDGPRGPCYIPKPGALIITRRTQAPLFLIGAEFSCCFRLRSWDKFIVPFPFSKVRMRALLVRPADLPNDREEAVNFVRDKLLSINRD